MVHGVPCCVAYQKQWIPLKRSCKHSRCHPEIPRFAGGSQWSKMHYARPLDVVILQEQKSPATHYKRVFRPLHQPGTSCGRLTMLMNWTISLSIPVSPKVHSLQPMLHPFPHPTPVTATARHRPVAPPCRSRAPGFSPTLDSRAVG